MSASHTKYLQTMETSIAALAALAGDNVGRPSLPVPVTNSRPDEVSRRSSRSARPVTEAVSEAVSEAVPVSVSVPVPVSVSEAVPVPVSETAPPEVNLHALMLDVVADKTGYPAEMLDLEMKLEGDLGIDSIKRVEILAAVQEQAPGMPDVDPSQMSTLETLGQIVQYMDGLLDGATAHPAAALAASAPALPAEPSPAAIASSADHAGSAVDLQALMLTVVADKTGYPAEMLDLEMKLEGDLGIDSIKRVEILAAVQEQAPGMPDVDPSRMSTLETLGQIVDYMNGLLQGDTAHPAEALAVAVDAEVLETDAPSPTQPSSLGRYSLQFAPCPAMGLSQPGLFGQGEVLVTEGSEGLRAALVEELRGRGVSAVAADAVPTGSRAVIFLGGLRPVVDVEAAIAVQREAFALARDLAPVLSEDGGLLVTVQDTGGRFGTTPTTPHRAYSAGLPALLKTASQEWPPAALKAIDLEVGGRTIDQVATALADELLLGGPEVEVGLPEDGVRIAPRSVLEPVSMGQSAIGKDDVVVITGGGRGVTAACAVQWASRTGARLLLLGRSELVDEPACCAEAQTDAELKLALLTQAKGNGQVPTPAQLGAQVGAILAGREIRATLGAIVAAGGQARYRAASVTDFEAIAAVLAETRAEWGPIKALVHGAGVLADQKIALLTDAQFDRVFDTKVQGLRVLLDALRDDPLRLIALFSSVSARCGNNGQAAYAMANEVLNKVAWAEHRARGGEVLIKSLGWGPWQGGMVHPQLRARFEQLGVPMIPLAEGAAMFADEMQSSQADQVEIVLGGEPRPEALLVVGSEGRQVELEVVLSNESHPYLAGHRIGKHVVVPVALALEWFARIARAFRPDLRLDSLHEVSVLKGMKLANFDGPGDRFVLTARQVHDDRHVLVALQIADQNGQVHYRAQARMANGSERAASVPCPELKLDAWGDAPVYGDVLFHTDDFQVIDTLNGIGDEGIEGVLRGVDSAHWGWERWDTDVAAMDGGLQLVLLWARGKMGGAALPMRIGEVRIAEATPAQGNIRCIARCHAESSKRGLADVIFDTEAGVRVAEFKDVEVILRPNEATPVA